LHPRSTASAQEDRIQPEDVHGEDDVNVRESGMGREKTTESRSSRHDAGWEKDVQNEIVRLERRTISLEGDKQHVERQLQTQMEDFEKEKEDLSMSLHESRVQIEESRHENSLMSERIETLERQIRGLQRKSEEQPSVSTVWEGGSSSRAGPDASPSFRHHMAFTPDRSHRGRDSSMRSDDTLIRDLRTSLAESQEEAERVSVILSLSLFLVILSILR
jgi:hypothetical protein